MDPAAVSRFIVAAHASGMQVVAWYLPSFARPALDRWRALRALRFRTPDGQGFDAFALDIESTRVRDAALRSRRVLELTDAVRSAAGARRPLGAIVPAPEAMRLRKDLGAGFPFRALRSLVNAFLPMDYFTYHETTAAGAHAYTVANVDVLRRRTGDPRVPIHLVGGEAGTADAEQVAAFVRAEREEGVLGASLYDFATTGPAAWSELTAVPANPRQRPPLPLALPQAAALGNIPGRRPQPSEGALLPEPRALRRLAGALPRLRPPGRRGAAVDQLALRAHAARVGGRRLEPPARRGDPDRPPERALAQPGAVRRAGRLSGVEHLGRARRLAGPAAVARCRCARP